MILSIVGEIFAGDEQMQAVAQQIQSATEDITLNINSPGGDVLTGMQLINSIQKCPKQVTARVSVIAASMAATVALACDAVQIDKNSIIMLHNCWTQAAGNKEDMKNAIAAMEAVDKIQHGIVTAHCKNAQEISDAMDAGDVWLTADEAAEIFDHVTVADDTPRKENDVSATGSLADLLTKTKALEAKEKEHENKKPNPDPEPEKNKKKTYVVAPALKALLDDVDKVLEG